MWIRYDLTYTRLTATIFIVAQALMGPWLLQLYLVGNLKLVTFPLNIHGLGYTIKEKM